MITGMEVAACQNMAAPAEVMQHIVSVESGYNPFAIGVVGTRLMRQPKNLGEAIATAQMLETKGYNFSVGLSQINRANFGKYGLNTYEQAFGICPNLQAGARILSNCYASSGNDWGRSFSCYYSGNFVTGYRDGYVQKVYASIAAQVTPASDVTESKASPIDIATSPQPLSPHGATVMASQEATIRDSAIYRVAIRSTALASSATTAPRASDQALVRVIAQNGDSKSQPAMTLASRKKPDKPAPQSSVKLASLAVAKATPDVFEPRITTLGQLQRTLSPATNSAGESNLTPPSTTASDHANSSQEVHDDAFVF